MGSIAIGNSGSGGGGLYLTEDGVTRHFKQIAAQSPAVAATDTVIGVQGGTTDVQYTLGGLFPLPTTSNLDFYVSTTGSDSNPGTISQPFRTIQKAATVATFFNYQNLYFPTIHVAAGTYNESAILMGLTVNQGSQALITGSPSTPSNTIVSATSSSVPVFSITQASASWGWNGFQIQNYGASIAISCDTVGTDTTIDNITWVSGNSFSVPMISQQEGLTGTAGNNTGLGLLTGSTLTFLNSLDAYCVATGNDVVDVQANWVFSGAQTVMDACFVAEQQAKFRVFPNAGSLTGTVNVTASQFDIHEGSSLFELKFNDRSGFLGTSNGNIAFYDGSRIENDLAIAVYSSETAPLAGSTVTTTPGRRKTILNPAGVLATLTVNFPALQSYRDEWSLATTQTITALTLATTDGFSGIVGAPSTLPANSAIKFFFKEDNNWTITA